MSVRTFVHKLGAALLAAAAVHLAHADILVGMSSGFTGQAASGVKENLDGAMLYIEAVNRNGGIRGEAIRLETLDDGYDPKRTAENGRKLAQAGAVALFLNRGTPNTQALLPVLAEHGIPLVAPSTGASAFHEPVNPLIFNVRATYQKEAYRVASHLASVGMTRIGVLHADDSFGADAVLGALAALRTAKLKPSFVEKFDRDEPDLSLMALAVANGNAQAVLLIGSAKTVAAGIKTIRAGASRVQVATLSNNASGGFVKLLGSDAPGVIVSQVFPNERTRAVPIAKEAADLAKAKDGGELTPAMMEGFAAAKVLVEGLRRAGPKPTRAKLVLALNGMSRLDIGGLVLGYSPTDHTGLEFADLSIIGSDGRFRR